MKKDMISAKQLSYMAMFSIWFTLMGTAPAVAARSAGSAGWLAPVLGALPVLLIVFLLQIMYRRHDERALDQIFTDIWGQIPGRILLALYALWCTLQASFTLRLYVENIQTGMFARSGGSFFALILLSVCYVALRGRLASLARASAVLFGLVALVLLTMLLLALPDIRTENLLPVNPLKAPSIALGATAALGPFGALIYVHFLSGQISDRRHLSRHSVLPLAAAALGGLVLFIFTIGILGAPLTAHMPNPLLIAVKNISGIQGNARLEGLITALWTMPAFVFITLMSMVALTLIAAVFRMKSAVPMAGPLMLLVYVGALSMGATAADVMRVNEGYVQYGHYVFQYGVPLLTLGLGFLRRKPRHNRRSTTDD